MTGPVRVKRKVCRAVLVFDSGRAKVESDDPSLHLSSLVQQVHTILRKRTD